MTRPLAALLLLGSTSLLAQGRVFVVDASGATSGSFRAVQPAVNAASSGDRIEVLPGGYPPFVIDGKGLTIVASERANLGGYGAVNPLIEIRGVPRGAICAIRGFTAIWSAPREDVLIDGCEGAVLVAGMRMVSASIPEIRVRDSAQVVLSSIFTAQHVDVTRSTVELIDVTVRRSFDRPCVRVTDGHVTLAAGGIVGSFFESATIELDRSTLVLTDDGSREISGGSNVGGGTPTIGGTGTCVLDPRVVIRPEQGAPAFGPGITVERRSVPWLSADLGRLGGSARASISGPPGAVYAIALAGVGERMSLPGIGGSAWLDPGAILAVDAGSFGATGTGEVAWNLPADPQWFGATLIWQGIADDGAGSAITFTAPQPLVVAR